MLEDVRLNFEIKTKTFKRFKKTISLAVETDSEGLLVCSAVLTTQVGNRREKRFESRKFEEVMEKFKALKDGDI